MEAYGHQFHDILDNIKLLKDLEKSVDTAVSEKIKQYPELGQSNDVKEELKFLYIAHNLQVLQMSKEDYQLVNNYIFAYDPWKYIIANSIEPSPKLRAFLITQMAIDIFSAANVSLETLRKYGYDDPMAAKTEASINYQAYRNGTEFPEIKQAWSDASYVVSRLMSYESVSTIASKEAIERIKAILVKFNPDIADKLC